MTDPSFQAYPVNGLQGDPAVYFLLKGSGEALLFDLGSIDALPQRDLLKVRHVFVSHAHMDHFIGFDRWLRVNVPHRRLLQIWGPEPFFERVQAKLRAYTWNLIAPDQVRFDVHEVARDGSVRSALLSNSDDFRIEARPSAADQHQLLELSDGSTLACAVLDHNGIPSLAYRFRVPDKLKVRYECFAELGMSPGPWVGQLQLAVREGRLNDLIEGRRVEDLAAKLLHKEAGPSFAYCTDAGFSSDNLRALREGLGLCRAMICESSFMDQDRERAMAKAHLTSRQAALMALSLGVKDFAVFHVSGIYGQQPARVAEEALAFFQSYSQLTEAELSAAIAAEML